MSSLSGYFHPASTCCASYAITYVFTFLVLVRLLGALLHNPELIDLDPPLLPRLYIRVSKHNQLTYHSTDTGDRPYKCLHCGDQFARRYYLYHLFRPLIQPCPCSDLLARHVNKCHASERQIPAVNTNRRKGSASASRATTSKQACDQCVQSSLPCDGSNPCGEYYSC